MHPDLARLVELQTLDTKAADARRTLANVPIAEAALETRLDDVRQTLANGKERLAANQTRRREIEKDLAVVQGRLSRYKDQLMEVKTNREYHAMQHEIEAAEREVQQFEDRLLELMLDADDAAGALRAAEAALASTERELAVERTRLQQDAAEVGRRLDALVATRDALTRDIPPEHLALYERLARARAGIAVAEARDERCSECHVRMRPQIFMHVRRNEAITQCDSCQRILYYVPPAASAPTPAA